MNTNRAVSRVLKTRALREGAGVLVHRGFSNESAFDPFLLFDDFSSEIPDDYRHGFPFHPHRGIATVTYIREGAVRHRDSLGSEGVLTAGDVQWMTAGSGIIHEEMPIPAARLIGFQLWINLAQSEKMCDPQYQEIKSADIPEVTLENGHVRVIAGTYAQVTGPIAVARTEPHYFDVSLAPATTFTHEVLPGHTLFLYVFAGALIVRENTEPINQGSLVLYDRSGSSVSVATGAEAARFLLISGKPLHEPIAWHGPIVMNSDAELMTAFTELQKGDFVKVHKSALPNVL